MSRPLRVPIHRFADFLYKSRVKDTITYEQLFDNKELKADLHGHTDHKRSYPAKAKKIMNLVMEAQVFFEKNSSREI
jgi:hypothetical protein